MKALYAVALMFSVMAAGCSNTDCKSGCDKLASCGYKSSGFSCDSSCEGSQEDCAACINDTECNDIPTGCASSCPGVSFTK